jgi:hypothetical protein
MKNSIHHIFSLAAAGLMLLASCKKDEAKVYFVGGTTPVLTSNVSDSISLPLSDTTATAATFSWTNPNYMFSDGTNSLDVNYYLQFDTTSGFNSDHLATVGINGNLSVTYTVYQYSPHDPDPHPVFPSGLHIDLSGCWRHVIKPADL